MLNPQKMLRVWVRGGYGYDPEPLGDYPLRAWTIDEALQWAARGADVPKSDLDWQIVWDGAKELLQDIVEGHTPTDEEVEGLAQYFADVGNEEAAKDAFVRKLSGRFHGDSREYRHRRLGEIWDRTRLLVRKTRRNPSLPKGSVSIQAARMLAADIGLRNLTKDELEQFRRGIEVEYEHLGTVKGNTNTIAKIAADHLDEDPHYYDKLDYWEAYASDVDLEEP